MLKAVIFDFDGIIVDTEPLHYKAFQEMLVPRGLGYSWEEYMELYIGFDDALGGVRLYRTSAGAPLTAADFTGSGGCSAADPACPGIGGNGLGDPAANTRILDAKAIAIGGSTLVHVTVGNGSGPVRMFRLPE